MSYNAVGRRVELITAALLYFAGALITGYAPDLVILIIGRVIYGTSIGMVNNSPIISSQNNHGYTLKTYNMKKVFVYVLNLIR